MPEYAVIITGPQGELQFSSCGLSMPEAEAFLAELANPGARIVDNVYALVLKDRAVNYQELWKFKTRPKNYRIPTGDSR